MTDITKLIMRRFDKGKPIGMIVAERSIIEKDNLEFYKKVKPLTGRKIAYYSKKTINSLYENITDILRDPSKY